MIRRFRRPLAGAVLGPLAVILAACSSGSSSPAAAPYHGPAIPSAPAKAEASLTETGSATLFPVFRSWAAAYSRRYPQLTIAPSSTSSPLAVAAASSGRVNIGASDTYLSSGDLSRRPGLLNIAVAVSALQVNYHVPGVKKPLKLDAAVLAQMYTGKITSWNAPAIKALNPGVALPRLTVVPLHQAGPSGDTLLFTSYLNAQDPGGWPPSGVGTAITWPTVPGARAAPAGLALAHACRAAKGCIAYAGIGYPMAAAGLGQARLKNASGRFVAPTPEAVSLAALAMAPKTPADQTISMINAPGPGSYPIVNYEYALVRKKQPDEVTTQNIRAFLDWAVTTGNLATYLTPAGFQALPGVAVGLSQAQIQKIG